MAVSSTARLPHPVAYRELGAIVPAIFGDGQAGGIRGDWYIDFDRSTTIAVVEFNGLDVDLEPLERAYGRGLHGGASVLVAVWVRGGGIAVPMLLHADSDGGGPVWLTAWTRKQIEEFLERVRRARVSPAAAPRRAGELADRAGRGDSALNPDQIPNMAETAVLSGFFSSIGTLLLQKALGSLRRLRRGARPQPPAANETADEAGSHGDLIVDQHIPRRTVARFDADAGRWKGDSE